ncbi:MAG: hypothetical protein JST28_13480 [Acidobacteria bacterium]|nr:hypothetical protein [Acidobacteriota bacterium]
MLKDPPDEANFYYAYSLDEAGNPIHMSARHNFNKIDWEGIYLYSDDRAECVEACLQTQVVNDYSRIVLHNGLPSSFQHFKVNGGGSHLAGRTGKEAIEYIASSPYNYWIEVEEYESAAGRIVSGSAQSEGLGAPRMRAILEYSYSDSGKLLQVTRTQETGWKTTAYAAQTATSIGDLADRLSEKIAIQVIESLQKIGVDSPLMSVELFYRQVTYYVPHIIVVTERQFNAGPGPVSSLDQKHWIDLIDQDFEPEMTEFTGRLNSDEDWEPGTRMLRNAALLITQRLPRLVATADCFVAFPMDWEFEGHELELILKECGATDEAITKLKSIGWLD